MFLLISNLFAQRQREHAPVPFRSCTKWGFVEYGTKKEVAHAEYDTVGVFSSGMAWVKKGDLYGFVNEKGALTIPIQYEKVHNFVYGQAYVSKGGKNFPIDTQGEEAQPRFVCGNSFMEGEPAFFPYKEGNKYGVATYNYRPDGNDKLTLAVYDSLLPTLAGTFALQNGKWGLIDDKGEVLRAFTWDNIYPMRNNYMIGFNHLFFGACQNGKWGLVDGLGNVLVPYKYEAVGYQFDDMNQTATVKPFDGKWGFIDMKGVEYFEERGDGCLNERIDFAQDLQLSANPNPFSDVLNVYFNLEKETKTVKISLSDLSGKIIFEEVLQDYPKGKHEYTLTIKDISVGVYVLHVDSKEGGAAVRVQKY